MGTLIIIGHLERAEALNPGFLFGYTFSVGWSESNRPHISTAGVHPLLPWSWKPITKVQLFGKLLSNGQWQPIGAFDVIADASSVNVGDIKTEATARYGNASSIKWPDPSTSIQIDKLDIHQDEANFSDPWPAHVIEMSSLPFPIAQHLNLSFALRAGQDLSPYVAFAAAPVVAKELDLNVELPPSNFQAPFRATDGYAVYDQGPGNHTFDIVAASNIVTSAAATVPESQGMDVLSANLSDWQQEFVLGVYKLFSVPDFIRFVLSQSVNADFDPLVPILIAGGVACLRDLISPGLDSGPLSGFPALQQLLAANPAVRQEVIDSVYSRTFPTTEAWTNFLRGNLSGISQLSLWSLVARNNSSSSQAISDRSLYYGQLKRDFTTVLAPIANESKPDSQPAAPPNHKTVMIALWNAMLDKLKNAPQSQISDVRSSLFAALPDTSYTSLWLDDTLGMFWKNILENSANAPNPFLERTRAISKYFVLLRLGLPITAQETPARLPTIWRSITTDWMPQGNPLTAWNGAKTLILQWIEAWHDSICSSFEPSSDAIPSSDSRNPLAVHVQYSSFDTDSEAQGDTIDLSKQDLFREIRGVGLLVKEQDRPQWTPVNLNAATDLEGNLCVTAPVGFPLRSGYIAKLRRGLIAYEGEPLSGGTALDNIDGLQECFSSQLQARPALPALLSADYHSNVHTPQLKYGRNFSFATFSILNSGILPPVMREGTEPRAWKASCDTIPGTWKTGRKLYQRTTRIGALRIMHEDAAPGRPAVLPTIPAGTYPRARDINWDSLWKNAPLKPVDLGKLNLVLLSPDLWTQASSVPKSSYQFRVRLPEVTWREWSAWGASLPSRNLEGLPDATHPVIPLDPTTFRAHRADIIEECYNVSLENKAMPAVDDPCLSRLLYFELLEEVGGELALKDKKFLPIPTLLGDKGRALYQAAGALVICHHNGDSVSNLSPNESTHTITAYLQEGKVSILRIWACLPTEYQLKGTNTQGQAFERMFAPGVLPPEKHPAMNYNGKDYLLVSSYDLLLEAASPSLPAPAILFNAFRTSLRLKQADPSVANVVASFPNPQPGISIADSQKSLFLNVGSVQAQRQSWRWEGRPVPLHPSILDSTTTDKFDDLERRWIWEVYPERPDGESVPVLMPVLRVAPVQLASLDTLLDSGCRYFEFADGLSAGSGPALPEQDLRGSHFRFSIQVTSRYESLMKLVRLNPSKFAHPDLSDPTDAPPLSLAWKSAYVPSRITTPSVPKLRLLLPLTEAYDREESKSSSLLAVFDDVFYDEVGLGDTLEAEIESIPVENTDQFVVQAGKDILLRGPSDKPSLETYKKDKTPPVKIALDATQPTIKWSGPIGNYRDFNNRYARFLATSFIIPAPTRLDGQPLDVRGWLASIRFRRIVCTRDFPSPAVDTTALKDYSGSNLLEWKRKSYPSYWTSSYWVQFLGSFSKFDGFDPKGYRIADLSPSIDANSGVLTLHLRDKSESVAIRPATVPNFPDSRHLYAVVTQRVFDFRGQYNQELYVATLQQDRDYKSWSSVSRIADLKQLKSDFRVRIIEVAFPTAGPTATQKPADPENLFGDLFQFKRASTQDVAPISGKPVRSPLDGRGSILRVSEPANSVTSNNELLKLCEIEEVSK
jgi:hypothetical protein